MAQKRLNPVVLENRKIIFRNFSGREGPYNKEGIRSFVLVLEDDEVAPMQRDGWNVKLLEPREEGDPVLPILRVALRFDNFPPKIVMVTSKGKTVLDEEACSALDYLDFVNVDLTINPSRWAVSGKTGVKAYLKNGFFTILEDYLELKYSDVPDALDTAMSNLGELEAAPGPAMIRANSEVLAITVGDDSSEVPF